MKTTVLNLTDSAPKRPVEIETESHISIKIQVASL